MQVLTDKVWVDTINNININKKDASILSEKKSSNVLVFHELAELYPEAKFIFVLRDPAGNCELSFI
ncbi:sulfotransferase [Catalinimonas niigatensis]|uniref:sulfotransferase n=1 Tax=Catalinimonas niigatensis TaxID=1397264 RepID=UPI0038991616